MDGNVVPAKEADEILKEARACYQRCMEADQKNRDDALDDLEFLTGKTQWTAEDLKLREGRPCLTINRLPQFVRQVTNEQRKTRPAIDVIPGDAQASKETAEVMQGLVRYIERNSRARIAYDQAFSYAVACGIGHFRVTTEYVDDASFDQDIVIKPIDNPFCVYRDPDDERTFVTEYVDAKVFEERYRFKPTPFADAGKGNDSLEWYDGDRVMVAEYWRVKHEQKTLHALSNGTTVEGKIDAMTQSMIDMGALQVVNKRTVDARTVEQYLLTYDKVIRKAEWKGRYIPILTTTGEEYNVNGERRRFSYIRFAKDPAKMYNYMASAEVEALALQPKQPWLGTEGSFQGHEAEFERANRDNTPYLEYVFQEGHPPPQRQPFAPMPVGIREARMGAAEDIKATLGTYDASLGARSNETSGVAIKARQQEGDTGTFHFVDNHARAIEQCGRIIVDLIPHIYDMPRTIRIITPTDQEEVAVINQMFIDPATGQAQQHDMGKGRYTVAVRVGPSFESKRQEMVDAMLEMAKVNPHILEVASDLIFSNLDFPQSEEIAKRMWTLLPPQIRGETGPPQMPPEVMAAQAVAQGQVEAEKVKAGAAQGKAQMDADLKLHEFGNVNATDKFRILVDAAVKMMIAEQANRLKGAELEQDAQQFAAEFSAEQHDKQMQNLMQAINARAQGLQGGFQ